MCNSFNDAANRQAFVSDEDAGIFGLDMQDIGAQQTGQTKAEFQAKLLAANHQPRSI